MIKCDDNKRPYIEEIRNEKVVRIYGRITTDGCMNISFEPVDDDVCIHCGARNCLPMSHYND